DVWQSASSTQLDSKRHILCPGWPTVSIHAWLSRGDSCLRHKRYTVLLLFYMSIETIYSFLQPLKANIGLVDTVILFALFGAYAVMAAREDTEEPDLVGPAAVIGALGATPRRLSVVALFLFAGGTIGASAEPFA